MTFEELKQEFVDKGFQIDGNKFISEFEDPNTVINGVHPRKRFEMEYVGEGTISTVCEDSDSDDDTEVIYQFDVLGPRKEIAFTICIGSFYDFTKLV